MSSVHTVLSYCIIITSGRKWVGRKHTLTGKIGRQPAGCLYSRALAHRSSSPNFARYWSLSHLLSLPLLIAHIVHQTLVQSPHNIKPSLRTALIAARSTTGQGRRRRQAVVLATSDDVGALHRDQGQRRDAPRGGGRLTSAADCTTRSDQQRDTWERPRRLADAERCHRRDGGEAVPTAASAACTREPDQRQVAAQWC